MLWSSIASFAALTAVVNGQYDGETSPPSYPSPWMRGGNGWADAYQKAQAFVSQLTLLEKVNLTTGVGWEEGPCVGNTGKSRNSSENNSLPKMLGRSKLNLNFLQAQFLVSISLVSVCKTVPWEFVTVGLLPQSVSVKC